LFNEFTFFNLYFTDHFNRLSSLINRIVTIKMNHSFTNSSFLNAYTTQEILSDLIKTETECYTRRFMNEANWAREMIFHLADNISDFDINVQGVEDISLDSTCTMLLHFCQAAIDAGDFYRAVRIADHRENPMHPVFKTLALNAKLMMYDANMEQMLICKEPDSFISQQKADLIDFISEFGPKSLEKENFDDPYFLTLYGKLYMRLNYKSNAEKYFIDAIRILPRCWPAWVYLVECQDSPMNFMKLALPDHWMKLFSFVNLYLKFLDGSSAKEVLDKFITPELANTPYIINQIATINVYARKFPTAIDEYRRLIAIEPNREEGFKRRIELSGDEMVSHKRALTANYYSSMRKHEEAMSWYTRAVKLDPNSCNAWTLLGHEGLELRNYISSSQAYSRALEIDPRDYRVWYSLGQYYDVLQCPAFATFYYGRAHTDDDGRMTIALGDVFLRQNDVEQAVRCLWKSHCIGNFDNSTLIRLGQCYEKANMLDEAAEMYLKFLDREESPRNPSQLALKNCHKFLAKYYFHKKDFKKAIDYAHPCLEINALREPMKRLLNDVNKLKSAKNRRHSKKKVPKVDVTETSLLDLVDNINDYGFANEEAIISEFLAEVLKCDDNRGESESENGTACYFKEKMSTWASFGLNCHFGFLSSTALVTKAWRSLTNLAPISLGRYCYHEKCVRCEFCCKPIENPKLNAQAVEEKVFCKSHIEKNEIGAKPSCPTCFKEFTIADKRLTKVFGITYHSNCVTCFDCKKPIAANKWQGYNQRALCQSCFDLVKNVPCVKCRNVLKDEEQNVVLLAGIICPNCFKCAECLTRLGLEEKFYQLNENVYCIKCDRAFRVAKYKFDRTRGGPN
ncbi:Cell division cycle protein 23 -like protein, partial [Trichinella sp. T6]